MGSVRPDNPQDLLDQLAAIFPELRECWDDDANPWREGDEFTFHRVMLAFCDCIGARAGSATATQWRKLGGLINVAVEGDDPLENAVSTCLLEHLHQVGVRDQLWPHLARRARVKSHA